MPFILVNPDICFFGRNPSIQQQFRGAILVILATLCIFQNSVAIRTHRTVLWSSDFLYVFKKKKYIYIL